MKENSIYDRKSILSIQGKKADFDELAKDCVAFSNAEGGVIDFGIEDNEQLPPEGQKINEALPVTVVNRIGGLTQGVMVNIEVLTAKNGGEFLRLHILRNPNAIAATSSGKIYLRVGDNSMPVGPEDIARLAEEKGTVRWEDMLTSYLWTDCDKEKLKVLLTELRGSDRVSDFVKQKDDKELLDFFSLTDEGTGKMTNLGVLFIGKQTQRGKLLNSPVVQCIKYDELGEKVNKWLWDDYSKNPQEIIDEIWAYIPEWKESTEISEGMYRRNIPAYSEKVVRELLGNALVHRQYTMRGDVFVNIYPDRIEVTNPGRLPLGVTPQNILHTTKKRNEHLANLFYALHLMEREGSGYDMMYEELLSQGKPLPRVQEGEDSVTAIVERRILNRETIKIMQAAFQNFELKQKQIICLGLIAQNESMTASQLLSALNIKDGDALRPWLKPLIDKGIVVTDNSHSKAQEYRVEPRLLKDSGYRGRTSLKRIENYRIKELIIEDLKIYQPCGLHDIHVRIGEEIPYRKLQRQMQELIKEGRIEQLGQKRWTQYQLVP